jgi:hypothetical protein
MELITNISMQILNECRDRALYGITVQDARVREKGGEGASQTPDVTPAGRPGNGRIRADLGSRFDRSHRDSLTMGNQIQNVFSNVVAALG